MYTLKNFSYLRPLESSELNDMESQMISDEARIDAQSLIWDSLDTRVNGFVNSLSLDKESGYIKLFYGNQYVNQLISAAPFPETGGYIPPTNLSVSSNNIVLLEGQTFNLSPTVTPSNCSLNIRCFSGDNEVAEVNRYGVVSALFVGNTSITVKCGSYTITVPTRVNRQITPNTLVRCNWIGIDDENRLDVYAQNYTKVATIPESGMIIPAGCKGTLTAPEGCGFRVAYIIREDGGSIHSEDRFGTLIIRNCSVITGGEIAEMYRYTPYIYNNTSDYDVYICMMVDAPSVKEQGKDVYDMSQEDQDRIKNGLTLLVEKL